MTARDSRRKQMAEYIDQKKSVEMDELCDVFAVSMNTVRADLAYLVSTGAVEKVYGGARSNLNHELHVFAQRTGLNQEAKSLIAKTAARRIFDKDIIYVDSGTTTMHLLEYLDPSENVTILTGNLHVVSQAYNMPNVEMIVLPGLMNRRTNALTDGSTLEFLGRFHFAKAFMGTSGVSESGKLNVYTYIEYEIKKLAVHNSQEVYLLVDSSKFGDVGFVSCGDISDLTELITDTGCPDYIRKLCNDKGVKLTVAE